MTRDARPLSSEIAGVSADADGAVTLTLRVGVCTGDAPGEGALWRFRLAPAEVARLEQWLRLRADGPFTKDFPAPAGRRDGDDA
jgi:hypothetical protein